MIAFRWEKNAMVKDYLFDPEAERVYWTYTDGRVDGLTDSSKCTLEEFFTLIKKGTWVPRITKGELAEWLNAPSC